MKNKTTNMLSKRLQKWTWNFILVMAIALTVGEPKLAQANESQPKLFEPYAPKPSGKCPDGWEIKILEGSQVENSTTLASGKDIKVTVPAYEIVPKSTPETVVLKDPGFDPVLGTTQKATIGAILTDYSETTIDLQNRLEKVTKELESGLVTGTQEAKEGDEKTSEPSSSQKNKPDDKKKTNSSSR
jgi:hypothetical protein